MSIYAIDKWDGDRDNKIIAHRNNDLIPYYILPKTDDGSNEWKEVQAWLDAGNEITDNLKYVKIFDKPLEEVRDRISYVPQRESVDWDFPASVMDIVLMGRYKKNNLFKRISKADRDIAAEALEKVNMLEFSKRQISQLSGGQQQRVFIARSLAQGADIYIMDEPFVGVDAATEEAILKLLSDMKKDGKTVVVVHHDLQTAKDFFDWIVLLNTRMVAAGPIEEIFNETLLQEAYGGKLNVLSQVGDLMKEKAFDVRES